MLRDYSAHRARFIASLAAALLATTAAMSQSALATALSYEDARNVLHSVSDLRQSSEAGVNRRDYEARAADSLGLPEIFVNATEVWGIKTGTITTPTPLGNIDFSQNFQGPRSSINGTWDIYTGGRITATQRSLAAGTDAARAELSATDERLDVQLAQVYFGLELAANIERTRASILKEADLQLARAVRFEQQGLIPKVERLSAQVSRDTADRELVRAQSDRKIAEARLQRLLRRDVAIEPATPLFVITSDLKPLPHWLTVAEGNNPTLAAFDARREQAKQGIVIAESRWKPRIFAFGSYSFIKHYETLIEPNWIAGIGINFTLLSREDRSSQVGAAREALRQVESLEQETRNEIDTAVETSYRKVEQAREQFRLLESTLALARENLRLRQRGFDEGTATSLDVNDARDALARAETARALAAYEFVVALAQLLEAAGSAGSLSDYVQQADVRLRP
jgi:outer membrane protein TolC